MNRFLAPLRPLAAAGLCALLALAAAPGLHAQVERPDQIVYPELEEVRFPDPHRIELDNGMVVLFQENHDLPLFEVRALIDTGESLEPADQAGLAGIAATVLRSGGTGSMSADELDLLLETKAAQIGSGVGEDSAFVTVNALAEDLPELLEVLADMLRDPAFVQDRLEIALNQARAGVARQNDQPQGILFRELNELVYGADSPYTYEPTYASLANIDRGDLVEWHRRHYRPERIVMGLVGDFETARAEALVREAFGDWRPEGEGAPETEVPYRTEPRPGVYVVEKNDIDQSNIGLAHLGVERTHPDFYALEVMNEVLGGSMSSRLFSEVRTRKGLAYAVAGQVGMNWTYPGTTFLFTTTKVSTTGEAIQALLDEVKAIRTDRPPTDDEVARAKQAILASYVFQVDRPEDVLNRFLGQAFYGYPMERLTEYQERIEAVTTAQVREAAKQYLQPENLAILVVGPSEGRDMDLTAFGEVTPVDITIAPPPPPPAPPAAPSDGGSGAP